MAVLVTLKTPSRNPQFEGLNAQTSRWLELEQTVNERIFAEPGSVAVDLGGRTVQSRLHPGRRGIWNQEVVSENHDVYRGDTAGQAAGPRPPVGSWRGGPPWASWHHSPPSIAA